MRIRRATLEDARAIAAIQVRAWKSAYQRIVPAIFLDALTVEKREVAWQRNLTQGASATWIADDDRRALGWISAAGCRDGDVPSSAGEVWALYVDPTRWRLGVGTLLMREAEAHLMASGFSEVTLWVLKDNARARAFYEAAGFVLDRTREKTVTLGGTDLLEVRLRKALT